MVTVDTIAFSKNAEGEFLIQLGTKDNMVRYSIVSNDDVQDILYLMPKCLKHDLAAKNLEMSMDPCSVECGPGCEGLSKITPEQMTAIFYVLALPDTPTDLDVLVQAIQVCLEK